MTGYVSVVTETDSVELVAIDDDVGIFREDDRDGHVHLWDGMEAIDLGFPDTSVSRIRSNTPREWPVRLFEDDGSVYVQNNFNESKVHVKYLTRETKLSEGGTVELDRDCVIEPGYYTRLRVTFEDREEETDSIPTAVTINALCNGFVSASRDSGPEALKFGRNLLNVVKDNPLDHEDFEAALRDLEDAVANLNARSVPSGQELNKERIENHERIANRIETLYELET